MQFNTTFQYVVNRSVSQSHVLCYYFTSIEQAEVRAGRETGDSL